MDKKDLQIILENVLEKLDKSFIRAEGPYFNRIGNKHYAINIKCFIFDSKKPLADINYNFNLSTQSDEEIMFSISESWRAIYQLIMQSMEKAYARSLNQDYENEPKQESSSDIDCTKKPDYVV